MCRAVLAAVKAGGAAARSAPLVSMATKSLLARRSAPTFSSNSPLLSSVAASAAATAAAAAAAAAVAARSAPRVLGRGQAAAVAAGAPAVFSSPPALRRFCSSRNAGGPASTSTSSSSPKLPESLGAASAIARSAASCLPPLPPGLGGGAEGAPSSSPLRRFVSGVAGPAVFASLGAASCCLAAATYQLRERDRNRTRITKTVIGAILGLELAKEGEKPPGFAESWPLRSLAARARNSWNNATATERAVWGVAAVNVAIFSLWHLPLGPLSQLWKRLMTLNFVQRLPPGPPPLPHTLLTANFSHSSFWHLAANTVTLLSIGELAARNMDSAF